MKRKFKLQEITFGEFKRHWTDSGRPPKKQDSLYGTFPPKHFKIMEETGYADFGELLDSMEDDFQRPKNIWFSDGPVKPWISERKIANSDKDYFFKLFDLSKECSKLAVEVTKDPLSSYKNIDVFNFKKDNGLWYVDYFHIRNKNFGLYTFEGIRDRITRSTPNITGLYTGPQYANAY
ncbi:hypothetical protein ACFLZZ_00690 [Nanoarchaeota archaeon]